MVPRLGAILRRAIGASKKLGVVAAGSIKPGEGHGGITGRHLLADITNPPRLIRHTGASGVCRRSGSETRQDRGSPDVGVRSQIIGGGSQDRSPDLCKLPAGLTMGKLMIASTIVDVAAIIAFGAAVSLMAMTFLLY